jgi:hypothetical protein
MALAGFIAVGSRILAHLRAARAVSGAGAAEAAPP